MKPLILALAAWLPLASLPLLAGTEGSPKALISGIRAQGTNLVVSVDIPAGTKRVTLETRSKATRGTWTPKGVVLPGENDREVTFTIPAAAAMEVMRAVTDDAASMPLPTRFYQGLRTFGAQTGGDNTQGIRGSGGVTLEFSSVSTAAPGVSDSAGGSVRTVSESDIWKFSGPTLYFFNQQRGLQVIDVSTPSRPVLQSTLPLAAYGEQMYVLPAQAQGSEWLALLAQEQCRWDSTEVILVQARTNTPALGTTLQVPGRVVESRLIGDVLVIASQGWSNRTVLVTNLTTRPWTGGGIVFDASYVHGAGMHTNVFEQTISEAFTRVTAIDLADPASPAVRSSVSLPATPTAIHATDRLLFVATASWPWQIFGAAENARPTNYVHVFDVADAAGNISFAGSFETAGRVSDKFKFGLDGDALAVVSQVDGQWLSNRFEPPSVVLETFSVANPAAPLRLARLNLVSNESVFATRFAPGRAYVVTFRQIDPLWIIDLSNPADPRIRGELEVPGWSTYIEPLGDRLLAMGVEGGRAAVSLFDVANPDHPTLVDKVFLGDGWSWSEANADEKAFRVFPDQNLALLPWHGRLDTNRWFQGIQLLDFTRDDLTLRGTINHEATARRAAVVGDSVLSISARELVSATIADRDHPAVSSTLELLSPADRVVIAGDNLLRIVLPRWSATDSGALPLQVGLSSRAEPDALLSTLSLTNSTLIGSTYRDGRLYLLQRAEDTYRMEDRVETNRVTQWTQQPPVIRYVTNVVVAPRPVPPVRECTNVVRTVEFPPGPGTPGYVTNVTITRCREIPQPPVLETNLVVSSYEVWQPAVLITNTVVVTNQTWVAVPGASSLSIVGLSGNSLSLLGMTTFTNGAQSWGGNEEAHWVADEVLAWTRSGSYYGNLWMVADVAVSVPFGPSGIFPRWWGGGGGGKVQVFDVSNPALPALVSTAEFDSESSLDKVVSADGKLFASLSLTEWPFIIRLNEINSPKTTYSLRVVDLAEPADPVVREPVSLPGALLGVSHGGNLLYARTNSFSTNGLTGSALVALAYDGVGASLVASREFPALQTPPVIVKADGRLLVSLSEGDDARLETWALSREGSLETYSETPLPAALNTLVEYGDFVVGEGSGMFVGLDVSGQTPAVTGTAAHSCALWLDPVSSDASAAASLWIPRGDFGLWRVSFGQP